MKGFVLAMIAIVIIGGSLIAYKAMNSRSPITEVDMRGDAAQARGYVYGDTTAPVQIIEFADFECPACMTFATITEPDVRKRLIDTKQAYIRFYDFPLPMHKNTWEASNAAACADEQGKFWEMHDRIFAGQDEWNGQATNRPARIFVRYASELQLDGARFESCYEARKYQSRVAANRAEAERRNVRSTPTFIIGNKMYPEAIAFDEMRKLVDEARAAGAPAAPPPVAGTGPGRSQPRR